MNNIYITGDRHGQFEDIGEFCAKMQTTKNDIMIILGDAGINYYVKKYEDASNPLICFQNEHRDIKIKQYLQSLPIQIFCIHGNHEARPETVAGYEIIDYHGGKAYMQKEHPNIVFAIDGQVYDFDGKKCLVIGGAYSVDKEYRLMRGFNWFGDEQPSQQIKEAVTRTIAANNGHFDIVLTHTCPFRYIPREMFLSCIDQSSVDNSTEEWLDTVEAALHYQTWYCGHYHTNKRIDKLRFLFGDIVLLNER